MPYLVRLRCVLFTSCCFLQTPPRGASPCPDISFEAKAQAFLEKSPLDLHFVSTFDIIMVVMFFVKAQGKEEPGIPDSFEGFIRFAF